MKLLFMGDASSPHTYNYIRYFVEKKHDLILFSMRPAMKEIKDLNINIIENKVVPKNKFFWFLYYLISQVIFYFKLKNLDADIVHVHDAYRYGLLALILNKDYILTPWGTDILIKPNENFFKKFLIKLVLLRAKFIVYDGKNIYNKLIEFGINKEKIKFFGFGIDIEKFYRLKNLKKDKKYLNKRIIISTRNFKNIYDIQTLIKSANEIIKTHKNVHFLLIGYGPEENNLKELVSNLSLSSYFTFLGKVSQDEIIYYLSISDIYISTSLSDGGIAISTVEAMSCSLPVIITDFAENRDWAISGKNGFVFPPSDVSILTNKISYCLENPLKLELMGKNSRKFITENYNYYLEKRKLELFYEKVKNEA